jgi:hypothetical protein
MYRRNILQYNKGICEKLTTNIILNGEKLVISSKSKNKTGYSLSPLLLSIALEVLAKAIRQRKK